MFQTNTNIYPHKITRAHTHYPVHVTAALNTSPLTDLHVHLTLPKFDMTIGSLFALPTKFDVALGKFDVDTKERQ